MWKIRFLSVLLVSFHKAHIQTFAFSMKLYFKIWSEWDVPLLKFHLFYILNESYKDISLQVCLLFTILSSFLLVGLCVLLATHQTPIKSKACNGTVVCTNALHVCNWSRIPSEEKRGVPFKPHRLQNHFFSYDSLPHLTPDLVTIGNCRFFKE